MHLSSGIRKVPKHELTNFPHVRLTPRRLRDLINLFASTFDRHSIQCAGYEVDSFDAIGQLVDVTGSKYASTLELTGHDPGYVTVELSRNTAQLYISDVDVTLLSGVSRKIHALLSTRPFWISLFPCTSPRSTIPSLIFPSFIPLTGALGISRAFGVDFWIALIPLVAVVAAYYVVGFYLDAFAHSRIQLTDGASFWDRNRDPIFVTLIGGSVLLVPTALIAIATR
jgi:hypothetical protein